MPLLSVVVPFHNVEAYIEACLESLARQTLQDFEVVLVDDGATDGTRALVDARCARDARFRVIEGPRQGRPGPARNVGIAEARGTYLAFVDSDDMVAWDGFERLVGSLQASGSQIAVAQANRFSTLGASPSYVHGLAILRDATATHLTRSPELVLDRMVWNKVYERDFWDRAGLEFPGILMGEDYPVSIAAHLAAEAVDVLTFEYYYWRERDGGDLQITRRNAEIGTARDRLASDLAVLDLVERDAPSALPLLRQHLLEVDLNAITGALRVNDPAERPELITLAQELLARLGPDAVAASTPFHKVRAARINKGDLASAVALEDYLHHHGRTARVVRRGRLRKRHAELLPGFDDGTLPRTTYEYGARGPEFRVYVEDGIWDGEELALSVLLDVPVRIGREALVDLWWQANNGTKVAVASTRSTRERPLVGPDPVAVQTGVDHELMDRLAGLDLGMWTLWIRVRSADLDLVRAVDEPATGRARYLPCRTLPDRPGVLVQPYRRPETGFTLWFRRPKIVLDEVGEVEQGLELRGSAWGRAPEGDLVLRRPDGVEHRYPVLVTDRGEGGWTYRAVILADDLVEMPDYHSPFSGQTIHTVALDLGDERRLLPLAPTFRTRISRRGTRSLIATRGVAGNLQVLESRVTPVIDSIQWSDATTLSFSGTWAGEQPLPTEVHLQHFEQPGAGVTLVRPLVTDGDRYSFEVAVPDLVHAQTEDRDAWDGPENRPWHLLIPFGDHRATQAYLRDALPGFAEPRDIEGRRVSLVYARNDLVRIAIGF